MSCFGNDEGTSLDLLVSSITAAASVLLPRASVSAICGRPSIRPLQSNVHCPRVGSLLVNLIGFAGLQRNSSFALTTPPNARRTSKI